MQAVGVVSKLVVIPDLGHLFLGQDEVFNVQASDYTMTELLLWFQKHLGEK
jgi:hypothetical protein